MRGHARSARWCAFDPCRLSMCAIHQRLCESPQYLTDFLQPPTGLPKDRRGFGKSANSKGFERSRTLAQPGPSRAPPSRRSRPWVAAETLSRRSRPWGCSWETQAGKAGVGVPGGALGVLGEPPRGGLRLSGPPCQPKTPEEKGWEHGEQSGTGEGGELSRAV